MQKSKYSHVIFHQYDPELPSQGGTDKCIRDLLKFAPPGEKILIIGVSAERRLNRIISIAREPGPSIDFLPVSRVSPANQVRILPHSIRMAFGFIRAMITHNITAEVVHIHRMEPGLLIGMLRPKRVLYFVHTNIDHALSRKSDSFWRHLRGAYRLLEKRVLNRVSMLLVFNKQTAQRYAIVHPSVERMRTWYDESVFYPSTCATRSSRGVKTVLWVGRIEAPKDPLLAVEVFAALSSMTSDNWEMKILGDGTLRPQVQKMAKEADNVPITFLGSVRRETVANHMRSADVLLMTSHFEGSPTVLYEAMGSGLPVVAPKDADPDGAIRPEVNGQVLPSRDPKLLAAGIVNASSLSREMVVKSAYERRASTTLHQVWKWAKSDLV